VNAETDRPSVRRAGSPAIASCHCGLVRIEVRRAPRSVTSCNCSICRRYAALWAYYQRTSVRIKAPRTAQAGYAWKRRIRTYYRCRQCGCITHYSHTDGRPTATVAVNARMFEPDLLEKVTVRKFDGADTWRYQAGSFTVCSSV
jgi:hypothetical protein